MPDPLQVLFEAGRRHHALHAGPGRPLLQGRQRPRPDEILDRRLGPIEGFGSLVQIEDRGQAGGVKAEIIKEGAVLAEPVGIIRVVHRALFVPQEQGHSPAQAPAQPVPSVAIDVSIEHYGTPFFRRGTAALFLDLLDRGDRRLDARRFGILRVEFEELLEVLQGLGQVALVEIDQPQAMVSLRPVALDLDRQLEIADGLVDLLVGEEDLADVVGRGRILGRDLEGLPEVALGGLEIAALQGRFPQARKGLERRVFLFSQVFQSRAVLVEDGLELGLRPVQVPFLHEDAADIQANGVDLRELHGEFLECREGFVVPARLEQGIPAVEEAPARLGGGRRSARGRKRKRQSDGRVGLDLTDLDLRSGAEITRLGSGHPPGSGTQTAHGESGPSCRSWSPSACCSGGYRRPPGRP
ncbi:MAG: hypothetical protein MZV63_58885 [Marinilabiliales bacterium]|nr:hypothetical protein [Marinilabiliales bacterium]